MKYFFLLFLTIFLIGCDKQKHSAIQNKWQATSMNHTLKNGKIDFSKEIADSTAEIWTFSKSQVEIYYPLDKSTGLFTYTIKKGILKITSVANPDFSIDYTIQTLNSDKLIISVMATDDLGADDGLLNFVFKKI